MSNPVVFSRVLAAFLYVALTGLCTTPALAQFTVDRELRFGVPTDKLRATLRQASAAREILAGDFVIAVEDLDDDGKREAFLLSRSPSLCSDGLCTLLVMKKTADGIETLLLQQVPARLALTRERVNGFRAIAALDQNGQIAVGDRRDVTLSGKPLVYAMRGSAAPQTTAGSAKAAPSAVSTKRGDKPTLEDIVDTIAKPSGQKDSKAGWTSMEGIPGLNMRQAKDALIETPKGYRRGGQLTLAGLGSTSVTWQGDLEGAYTADIRTGARIPTDRYGVMLKQQFSASAQVKQIRGGCKGSDWFKESAIFPRQAA